MLEDASDGNINSDNPFYIDKDKNDRDSGPQPEANTLIVNISEH